MKNLRNFVPDGTFLAEYLDLYSAIETAQQFDFFCALWSMSHAINRQCRLARPFAPLSLNLFCILVSDPGVGRKSSAINHAVRLVRRFNTVRSDDIRSLPLLVTGTTTPEQFEHTLRNLSDTHGTARASIAISEMARFIGREGYKAPLAALLIDLYDCPDVQETLGTRKTEAYTLRNTWMSLLTGTTPSWLSSGVSPAVMEGGFVSRTLFITATANKSTIPWPETADVDAHEDALVLKLESIHEASQQSKDIHLSASGRTEYERWYAHRGRVTSHFEKLIESREHDHVLRLATLLSFNDASYEVSASHIRSAVDILGEVTKGASALFVEGDAGEIKAFKGVERLRTLLSHYTTEHVGHRDLYVAVRTHLSIEEFKTVISIMHELGMIEIYKDKNTKGTFYRATKALTGPSKMQAVLRRLTQTDHSS